MITFRHGYNIQTSDITVESKTKSQICLFLQATDKMKSEEEMAKEEMERLEKLEVRIVFVCFIIIISVFL